MVHPVPDTDELLALAERGDVSARGPLLARHRARLTRLVASRMDRRLSARLDPSDVVQDTLALAAGRLTAYLKHRPIPFYPWLRQLALEQLVKLHRRHIHTQKRSVKREDPITLALSDDSAVRLAERLVTSSDGPGSHVVRNELIRRVQVTLDRLAAHDREVLVMRHVEQLRMSDIAGVLAISESAARSRYLRALERFRRLLGDIASEDQP